MTQLRELAEPFPAGLVKDAPRGKYGDYVAHSTYTERLLSIVGNFDWTAGPEIRGHAPAIVDKTSGEVKYPERPGAIVGCYGTLTVVVDGRTVSVTEVGTEDTPAMHHDAENLKNAASDAFKRCAMRLGLGLHLWSRTDYFLDRQLDKNTKGDQG